ncbi:hypothetical protein ABBQ38_013222 [Trebouxia sp. C0009 RCD-2024]
MLSVSSLADKLGYEISGTTDVAVVLRHAARINQPANGLRIVLGLKKKRDSSNHFQAMITLLLSNLLSCPLKPIVVLTDLRDDYTFYWLDGCTVFYYPADSPGIALGIIKSFLQQEEVTAISEVQPVQGCLDVELPLIKRQRLDLEQEYHDQRLDDLEDKSVDNEQSRAHKLAPMLRRFLNSPHTEQMIHLQKC